VDARGDATGGEVAPDVGDTPDDRVDDADVGDTPDDRVDDADVGDTPDDRVDDPDVGDTPDDRVDDADAGESGTTCGPFPGGECAAWFTCDVRSCGLGAGGTCVPTPGVCPDVYAPVCGCNGVTYGNDCERLVAGVALDHVGECRTTGECGPGRPCPTGQVCDITGCGPEAVGTCVPDPGDVCPPLWGPECGCDGRTYGNRCERLSAGVALDHVGECRTTA
jgi:hypothetical protein